MKYGVLILGTGVALGALVIPLFGGAPTLAPSAPASAQVLFGGDLMFDRFIRTVSESRGYDYPLSCIAARFAEYDLVVANLEGPITSSESVSVGSRVGTSENTRFTFSPQVAAALLSSGIDVVHLGNNHILDFGRVGLLETKTNLGIARVAYFGDPDRSEESRVLARDVNGVPLTLVSWNDWADQSVPRTEAAIRAARDADRVPVVFAHWGDEYVEAPDRTRELARRFVDAGALLVVGSHSHVVGASEEYRGVPIYYSLGNFVFDQYFSEAVQRGLLLSVVLTNDGVSRVDRIPIRLHKDGRTCPE